MGTPAQHSPNLYRNQADLDYVTPGTSDEKSHVLCGVCRSLRDNRAADRPGPGSACNGSDSTRHANSSGKSPRNSSPVGRSAKTTRRTPEAQLRRRAQNLAAQRAFRERRERYVLELTERTKDLESRWKRLQQKNERLKSTIVSLRTIIISLYGPTSAAQITSLCENSTAIAGLPRDMSADESVRLHSFALGHLESYPGASIGERWQTMYWPA